MIHPNLKLSSFLWCQTFSNRSKAALASALLKSRNSQAVLPLQDLLQPTEPSWSPSHFSAPSFLGGSLWPLARGSKFPKCRWSFLKPFVAQTPSLSTSAHLCLASWAQCLNEETEDPLYQFISCCSQPPLEMLGCFRGGGERKTLGTHSAYQGWEVRKKCAQIWEGIRKALQPNSSTHTLELQHKIPYFGPNSLLMPYPILRLWPTSSS